MPRMTDWIDTIISLDPATGGQANVSLMTGVAPVNMRGVTLIRTLVSLSFSSVSIAGVFGVQNIFMGIGITSQEAFAAGVLPDPETATDKPPRGWVYRSYQGVAQNSTGSPVLFEARADIRGARKIENGELYLIVSSTAVSGTSFTTAVRGLVRVLTKLP